MAGVPGFDPSRLFTQLQNTGLAIKDNPLYQLLYLMIQQLIKLTIGSNAANIPGGGGSSSTTIIQQFGSPAFDGQDGQDGLNIVTVSNNNSNNNTNAARIIALLEGDYIDESLIIIQQSIVNPTIITGPPGLMGEDGQDGQNGILFISSASSASVAWTVISNTQTGSINNWAPSGFSGNTEIEWAGASDATITGMAGGVTGQFFTLKNTGTKVIYFIHQSGSSTAANRFQNNVTSIGQGVAPNGVITYIWNGTYWQLVSFFQGAAIPIVGATFTADLGGTWTPGSVVYNYLLEGNFINVFFDFTAMTIVGAPQTLLVTQPYTTATGLFRQLCGMNNAGVRIIGLVQADGTTSTQLQFSRYDAALYAAGAGNVFGQFRFPIT